MDPAIVSAMIGGVAVIIAAVIDAVITVKGNSNYFGETARQEDDCVAKELREAIEERMRKQFRPMSRDEIMSILSK